MLKYVDKVVHLEMLDFDPAAERECFQGRNTREIISEGVVELSEQAPLPTRFAIVEGKVVLLCGPDCCEYVHVHFTEGRRFLVISGSFK